MEKNIKGYKETNDQKGEREGRIFLLPESEQPIGWSLIQPGSLVGRLRQRVPTNGIILKDTSNASMINEWIYERTEGAVTRFRDNNEYVSREWKLDLEVLHVF